MWGRPSVGAGCAIVAVAAGCVLASGEEGGAGSRSVRSHFEAGEFDRAVEAGAAGVQPPTPEDALLLARVALYSNRFDESERWLEEALGDAALAPAVARVRAEIRHRQDRLGEMSAFLEEAGEGALAAAYEPFRGAPGWRITASDPRVEVPFKTTHPLPLLRVSVNGVEGLFILDTGGGETILDPEFAAACAAEEGPSLGDSRFAGDKTALVKAGRVDVFEVGGVRVEHMPVRLLPTKRFGAVYGGAFEVSGVLGTISLYHFNPTIDYAGGRLVLRTRDEAGRAALREDVGEIGPAGAAIWLGGDHLILARGRVNGAEEGLMFLDTGLAGAAFTCPRSTLDAAGIVVDESKAVQGVGGGGAVSVTPFTVESLAVGDARVARLMGLFGPFPPSLERSEGYRIAGIVSHAYFARLGSVTFDFDAMRLHTP